MVKMPCRAQREEKILNSVKKCELCSSASTAGTFLLTETRGMPSHEPIQLTSLSVAASMATDAIGETIWFWWCGQMKSKACLHELSFWLTSSAQPEEVNLPQSQNLPASWTILLELFLWQCTP